MTIRKRTGSRLLAAAAATAAVAGLCAVPALASTPRATTLHVTIRNGGKFTAKASKTVLSNRGVNVVCTSSGSTPASSASGNIPSGTHTGTSPVKVGTTTNLKFNNCNGPLGAVHTKILNEPYKVSVDSKTNSKGQTDGIVGPVKVKVTMTGCSFIVTGTAPGFYTNGKHTLTLGPTLPVKPTTRARLTVSNVSGCATLVQNGDHPTYKSVYTLSRKGTIHSS